MDIENEKGIKWMIENKRNLNSLKLFEIVVFLRSSRKSWSFWK